MHKRITIVTPTFNSSRYLEETILSIISQDYPDLEYIIIDGGSTDGTLDIIKKYQQVITYWISEPDNGMYHAIQKGFSRSTGEIMAWLNSDDKYHKNSLHIVNQIFTDLPDINWIVGMPSLFNENGSCVKITQGRGWSKSRFWLKDFKWIQQESVFWRRSLWDKAGSSLSSSYQYAGDFELWCRFFQFAELYSVGTALAGFRKHGVQLSSIHAGEYNQEADEIYKLLRPASSERIRFYCLKPLWRLRSLLLKIRWLPVKCIVLILTNIIDMLNSYPVQIDYDFKDGKWKATS